ncbi:MAG: hypothetical protein LBC18_01590 [Opitutaceae bacterium]|nr:hypothetical protein [Opitutaceae bacterium]
MAGGGKRTMEQAAVRYGVPVGAIWSRRQCNVK